MHRQLIFVEGGCMSKKRFFAVLMLMFLLALSGLAQGEAAEMGRAVTRADWIDRIPVVIGAIVLVLLVDAFFIVPIVRSDEGKEKVSS
jgi:hypothetical protein